MQLTLALFPFCFVATTLLIQACTGSIGMQLYKVLLLYVNFLRGLLTSL